MKEIGFMKYYIVDAFTDKMFKGNQAGVCILEEWLDNQLLQNIAAENNLAETAFVVKHNDYYDLRWFTPVVEIDLCGHATLASAFVISNFIDRNTKVMRFKTKSGMLTVRKVEDLYEMDFPTRKPTQIEVTSQMEKAIGLSVNEAHLSRDLLLLVDNEQQVKKLSPNFVLLKQIADCFAVIVTAKGDHSDFVSRFFAPNAGILEDPVTGSSHSTLIPFWSERLGKDKMIARQLSKRSGVLFCEYCGNRVKISGKAILYLQGEIMRK